MSDEEKAARPAWTRRLREVTHALRAPLASITGYADLLHRRVYGDLSPEQARAVEAIHRRGGELQGLLDQFVRWVYLVAGEEIGPVEGVPIVPLLDDVLRPINRPGLRLISTLSPSTKAWASEEELAMALEALLANALDAARNHVEVRVDEGERGPSIVIVDDGPGLPQAVRATLDAPGGVARDESSAGLGLGIALARGWIHAMGGRLIFEDTADGGTKVRVELKRFEEGP